MNGIIFTISIALIEESYVQSGFKAAKARYLLKHHGIQGVQLLINTGFKVKQPPIEEMLLGSVNTKSMDNGEKLNFEKRSALETNMLVAMLVATVTFTAAFTMPGGYKSEGPDQGLANLTTEAAFKAFIFFNTTAFCFSVVAVYLQFDTSQGNYRHRIRYMHVAANITAIAILGMVLAFASGMHVVLAKSIGLAITAYALAGCLILTYTVGLFVEPSARTFSCFSRQRKYLLELLIHYGVI